MKKIALPEAGIETLYGAHDANLKHIAALLNVSVRTQGSSVIVEGDPAGEQRAARIFDQLRMLMEEGYTLGNGDVKTAAQLLTDNADVDLRDYFLKGGQKQVTKRRINPKSVNQRKYLDAIEQYDIVFGVGPAGTGKTYLAMAQGGSYPPAQRGSRVALGGPARGRGGEVGVLARRPPEKGKP